jgi:hypothetical protein
MNALQEKVDGGTNEGHRVEARLCCKANHEASILLLWMAAAARRCFCEWHAVPQVVSCDCQERPT